MIKTQVICDVCEQPLPVKTKSVDGKLVDYVELHKTKIWNTRSLYPHLCENCALKIDNALLQLQNEIQQEQLIAARNKKLNAERRERLGTNG